MLKTASWMVGNCRFAAPAHEAAIVAYALQSVGIRISTSKIASLMKVALPSDWNTLDANEKRTVAITVQKLFQEHFSRTGRYPNAAPNAAQVQNFLNGLAASHVFRFSLEDDTMQRLSAYISNNWKELTEPSSSSLETILDTMDLPYQGQEFDTTH